MIRLDWAAPPLGVAYEKFTGQGLTGLESTAEYNALVRSVDNWKAALVSISEPHSAFLRTLSTTQRRSLRLLVEWWTGAYESELRASDYREGIVRNYATMREDHPMDHSKDPEYRLLDKDEIDGYESRLLNLWQHEFMQYDITDFTETESARYLAARLASCQRVAFGSLARCTGVVQRDRENVGLQQLEQYDHGLPVGGVIEACPWLPEDERTGLPFYLWDVANKCTVETRTLRNRPIFTVISHTWGRWRSEGSSIAIPGVPWAVPQNSRFAIEDLPSVLFEKSAQFLPATYVWFDLFCIPQDHSELGRIEIARQAAIFGSAYHAIAWLNYVEGWKGVVLALQYMVSYWLDRDRDALCGSGRRILRPYLRKQPGFNTALWPGFTHEQDASFAEVNGQGGWFTSLWTLQELYLRPDMLLADRHWNICQYPDAAHERPLTIDTLVAVTWTAKMYLIGEECSRSDEGLLALVVGSGLEQLLEPDPLSPLCLGSRRRCTGRRAEAIMSVVGVTRWYTATEDAEKNLVLDHYPVEFLRELYGYLGAMFFKTVTLRSAFYDIMHRTIKGVDGVNMLTNVGSMLPFDPWDSESRGVYHYAVAGLSDHPTTSTWTIEDSGVICMSEVAIVASTDEEFAEETDHDLMATIYLPTQLSWQTQVTEGNLHQTLISFMPDFMKHAVCLRTAKNGWCEGIILIQLKDDPQIYAKLGNFIISSSMGPVDLQTWDIGHWLIF